MGYVVHNAAKRGNYREVSFPREWLPEGKHVMTPAKKGRCSPLEAGGYPLAAAWLSPSIEHLPVGISGRRLQG